MASSATPAAPTQGILTALAGGTGLVGSHILTTLLTHPSISSVAAFSRRPFTSDISDPHTLLRPIINPSSDAWPSLFPSTPAPTIFISALGTTKAQAGSLANQRKIDHDLNLSLAQAAKGAGVKIYVLISSNGANAKSMIPYSRMKGELEDAVSALGFEKVIVLRPGLITGTRRESDSRPAEYAVKLLAGWVGKVAGSRGTDFWAQDAEVIGRAAVNAGLQAAEGKGPAGARWDMGMSDIVRLGRTEWKGK